MAVLYVLGFVVICLLLLTEYPSVAVENRKITALVDKVHKSGNGWEVTTAKPQYENFETSTLLQIILIYKNNSGGV